MRAPEAVQFSNIAATTGPFVLEGGRYQVVVTATWSAGSVTFEQLGPDGSTYLNVDASYAANGGGTYDLPPGQFRFAVTTATAVYAFVTRIPGD